jgi:hypothetical protein
MDPPQHIVHQCESDSALQESSVVVQSILDLYYTQKVGAFIAKQHLDKPDIVSQHSDQALQRRGRRWHSVVGSRAPGLVYAAIFLCDIPRISFAF